MLYTILSNKQSPFRIDRVVWVDGLKIVVWAICRHERGELDGTDRRWKVAGQRGLVTNSDDGENSCRTSTRRRDTWCRA